MLKAQKGGSLPAAYQQLRSDTARMRFLERAIADSLDEGQLTHVLDWARIGLSMAEAHKVDTMKGIFLFDIGKAFTYQYNQYDSAIRYYKQVLPYFPDKLRKYHVFSLREIMDRYADLGNKDSSFAYMDKLNALIDTMAESNPKRIALAQNIAVVYQSFGMYRSAVRYFEIAVKGNRANKNYRGLGLALANLAELYSQMEDHNKAIITAKEALPNLADVNRPFMQTASNIADYYITLGNYDSAMHYLGISNDVVERINDQESRLANKTVLARIHIGRRQFSEARKLLDEAINGLSAGNDNWTTCRALLAYADLDTSLGNYADAKARLQKTVALSQNNNFVPFTILALQKLALVCARTGDYKAAWQYQLDYTRYKDSSANARAKADLNDLEISYKTLQKEQEIALLKKDNDVKSLQLKNSRQLLVLYLAGFVMLLSIGGLIFYQRQRRHKIETEKIKAELQTQILRSQMNPHFIFNCLNSIENFIMQNNKRQASDYLNKFSQLIRSILDSSRNEMVPLVKDMETLQLYVELEQLRFNNKFRFSVYIDPALAGGDYQVPSLLVQPFVENAIVHGMAHSEEKDLSLSVKALLEGGNIRYLIQDNGVGREKAKVYNMHNEPHHKSVGLKITEERISIFNDSRVEKEPIRIVDLYDEQHRPEGTLVEIVLKAI